ncbi:targeting protein for Xklp2-like isoform X1 [Homalodisca vitripennis]|uniref:targeting protein for Xklp2-like isoform X1 n=1 Tax=Homalodisca vitripennis TaxID=197043 RepID=UPI001EEBD319|nr:targeting protein for Xklp2-like isoform X1 [Homalodisca vitripennis]
MNKSEGFEFNAPQFLDFNADLNESDGADTFFDVESEVPSQKDENKENKSENLETIRIKEEIVTPPQVAKNSSHAGNTPTVKSIKKEQVSEKKREIKLAVRRLSVINKPLLPVAKVEPFAVVGEKLSDDMKKLSVKAKKRTYFDGIEIDLQEEKQHTMTTRTDQARKTPTIGLRTRVVNKSMGGLNRKRKFTFGECEAPIKYMAMAEQILHFQKDTPPRFHTSKRRSSGIHGDRFKARQSYNPRRTIAMTPKLLTSKRSRPVDLPSQEAREEMELLEMKKHQVKAMPLNDKVLQPPKPIQKSEKATTVPDPFNLTQVFKKAEEHENVNQFDSTEDLNLLPTDEEEVKDIIHEPAPKLAEEEPFRFTARPMPKVIYEKPVGVGQKQELPITIPASPAITKSARFQKTIRVPTLSNDNRVSVEDLTSLGVPCKFTSLKSTEVKPFSFERRDKELREKKEKKIQEILEAEKKARDFKATPAPSFEPPKEIIRLTRSSMLDSSKSSVMSMTEESHQPFKARSPKVLRKAPFKPSLQPTHSQPLDIHLHTERRLAERQEFEMKQYLKEEELAIMREQKEMERREKEKEEIARLRQETVHKAQPMPKFKVPPKRSPSKMPLTDPKSPRFTSRKRADKPCVKPK